MMHDLSAPLQVCLQNVQCHTLMLFTCMIPTSQAPVTAPDSQQTGNASATAASTAGHDNDLKHGVDLEWESITHLALPVGACWADIMDEEGELLPCLTMPEAPASRSQQGGVQLRMPVGSVQRSQPVRRDQPQYRCRGSLRRW